MQNPVYPFVYELAAAIRQRNLSACEVVDGHLERIRSRNPALNAIVTLDEENETSAGSMSPSAARFRTSP
jgi:amidase